MKAYINIRVVIDSKKKTVVANSRTKVDRAIFTSKSIINQSTSQTGKDNFGNILIERATKPLEIYGDIFGV